MSLLGISMGSHRIKTSTGYVNGHPARMVSLEGTGDAKWNVQNGQLWLIRQKIYPTDHGIPISEYLLQCSLLGAGDLIQAHNSDFPHAPIPYTVVKNERYGRLVEVRTQDESTLRLALTEGFAIEPNVADRELTQINKHIPEHALA